MRRRFVLWGVIVAALLGGSSFVGVVVKGVIKPREYDYTRTATPGFPATAVRADLTTARPTVFGPPATPDPTDAATFQAVLDGIGDPDGFRRPWVVQQQFNFE